jgi:hypothetical protein
MKRDRPHRKHHLRAREKSREKYAAHMRLQFKRFNTPHLPYIRYVETEDEKLDSLNTKILQESKDLGETSHFSRFIASRCICQKHLHR